METFKSSERKTSLVKPFPHQQEFRELVERQEREIWKCGEKTKAKADQPLCPATTGQVRQKMELLITNRRLAHEQYPALTLGNLKKQNSPAALLWGGQNTEVI